MHAEVPPSAAWPPQDLEALGRCPVCGDSRRTLLHERLTDQTFGAAEGEWTLYACEACGLCYPDPRPTPASIGRAYRVYYTHEDSCGDRGEGTETLPPWLRAAAHDWLSHRWGIVKDDRLPQGRWLALLVPGLCRSLDFRYRHLRPARPGARLLDLGCGGGDFLAQARAIGWNACGIDPDPSAVAAALRRGHDVRQGGLPDTGYPDESFDAVTLSHVIEHLHDPVQGLREVRRILRPGGHVWIVTPHAGGWSARRFGRDWRGWEPPRHLAVFTAASLLFALRRAGFAEARLEKPPLAARWYGEASRLAAAADGRTPLRPSRLEVRAADLRAMLSRGGGEELVATARAVAAP